jgi:hypothetical protein
MVTLTGKSVKTPIVIKLDVEGLPKIQDRLEFSWHVTISPLIGV